MYYIVTFQLFEIIFPHDYFFSLLCIAQQTGIHILRFDRVNHNTFLTAPTQSTQMTDDILSLIEHGTGRSGDHFQSAILQEGLTTSMQLVGNKPQNKGQILGSM